MERTIYQTEVISGNRDTEFYEAVYDLAGKYDTIASGNSDLTRNRPDLNAFNLFETEESAKAFREEIFKRKISNAVYITPITLTLGEKI